MKRFSFFAHEGIAWIFIASILAGSLWVQYTFYAALPLIAVVLLLMRFYYDPERDLPSHPLGVMSPVDGVVIMVELYHDPFLDRTVQRIRIRSDLFGVYNGRSPTEGKIVEYWPEGSAFKQDYAEFNTKGGWWIKTDEGDDVIMLVSTQFIWGRVRCDIQAGERVGQARRCGHFPQSSIVDLLIDEFSFIDVSIGQHVEAGVDTIAKFNHDIEPVE